MLTMGRCVYFTRRGRRLSATTRAHWRKVMASFGQRFDRRQAARKQGSRRSIFGHWLTQTLQL